MFVLSYSFKRIQLLKKGNELKVVLNCNEI